MTELEKATKETFVGKTFTTHKKPRTTTIDIVRKISIVRRKCQQLVNELLLMFPDGIVEDNDLTDYIERYIGSDKATVRAYKGYSGYIRIGRCGDNKIIGLSRKGYLEKFFLMQKKGRRWAIPIQAKLSYQDNESSCEELTQNRTNEKISISISPNQTLIPKGKGWEGKPILEVSLTKGLEKKEDTEKERNFSPKIMEADLDKQRNLCPKIYPMISESNPNLAHLKLLSKAKPTEELS